MLKTTNESIREQLLATIEVLEACAIFCLDAQGMIRSWNAGAEHILGYSAEEMIGHHYLKLYEGEPSYQADASNRLQKTLDQGFLKEEHNYNRRDGKRLWLYTIFKVIYDADHHLTGYAVITHDYSPLKLFEKLLQEDEESYKSSVSLLSPITWVRDSKGAFTSSQASWEAFTGQRWENYQGFGWVNAHHPKDRESVQSFWRETKTIQPHTKESRLWSQQTQTYRYVLTNSTPIVDENTGQVKQWLGITLDIDALKQKERALEIMTQRFELTLRATRVGIWQWNIPKDQIVGDQALNTLFGLKSTNIFARNLQDFLEYVHPEDRNSVQLAIKKTIEEDIPFDIEYQVVWPDKSVHSLSMRAEVYRHDQGTAVGLMGICLDITTHKCLEKERLLAIEQCAKEERLRSEAAAAHSKRLIEFIDTICHEIRNPLNGIYGSNDLIVEALKKMDAIIKNETTTWDLDTKSLFIAYVDELKDLSNGISKCAEQQKVIVDDVLDLSKIENGKMNLNQLVFQPKEVIANVIHMFTAQLALKKLALQLNLPKEDFWVIGDPARLSQIISNLMSNAVKFTHQGTIIVTLTYDEVELAITVGDSGIGMTVEEQQRLFEDFGQAHPKIYGEYGGTGLGLSISKKLVELMGGRIYVRSEKGIGTQFGFTVCCKQVNLEKQVTVNSSESLVITIPKNILIVEDNLVNQKILKRHLETIGHHCQLANHGIEAIEYCQRYTFDIIFMDIEMPVKNGLDATQEIRAWEQRNHRSPTFIIGLSGDARQEKINLALNSGMNEYLTKPYHKQELYQKILQSEKRDSSCSSAQKREKTKSRLALFPYSKPASATDNSGHISKNSL